MNNLTLTCKHICLITMLLLMAPVALATMHTQTVNGITYEYHIEDGVAMIACPNVLIMTSSGYRDGYAAISTNTVGKLVVPSKLGGCPVEIIGEYAFARCPGLTSIVLPSTVKTIDIAAFAWCTSLTSIVIPEGVTKLNERAFDGCSKLSVVTLPSSLKWIDVRTFRECSSLTSITIPEKVITILWCAFEGCQNLKNIEVNVHNQHFSSRDGVLFDKAGLKLLAYPGGKLGAYVIPEKTEVFETGAFNGCPRLTALTIPKEVDKIDQSIPFINCDNLSSIQISPENPNYSCRDGVLFNKDGTVLIRYIAARKGAYSIPEGVKTIKWAAFFRSLGLTSLYIPASVEVISDGEFGYCPNLKTITVDAKNAHFTSVDGVLFDKLTNRLISYPPGKQKRAAAYVIPSTVSIIGARAFAECSWLTDIVIPNNVKEIKYHAFIGCNNLVSVRTSAGLLNMEYGAFRGCSNITSVIVPATLNVQQMFADSYEKITNVVRHTSNN